MRTLTKPPSAIDLTLVQKQTANTHAKSEWRAWESAVDACKDFRRVFLAWALQNQNGRCGYCSLEISSSASRDSSVDHVAPKGDYPWWTFESQNLVLACFSCNTGRKKSFDAVMFPTTYCSSEPYHSTIFAIFHPYLDDAAQHFTGGWDGTLANAPSLLESKTFKGDAFVALFELATEARFFAWLGEHEVLKMRANDRSRPMVQQRRKSRILSELIPDA